MTPYSSASPGCLFPKGKRKRERERERERKRERGREREKERERKRERERDIMYLSPAPFRCTSDNMSSCFNSLSGILPDPTKETRAGTHRHWSTVTSWQITKRKVDWQKLDYQALNLKRLQDILDDSQWCVLAHSWGFRGSTNPLTSQEPTHHQVQCQCLQSLTQRLHNH